MRALILAAALSLPLASSAPGQAPARVSFSLEWQGPNVGQIASTPAIPMTEADVLLPFGGVPAFGPLPKPGILFSGGQLGLTQYATCLGHPGGTPCGIEVDALSYGNDNEFGSPPALLAQTTRLYFSVDEHAVGHAGSVVQPSVRSEAAAGVRDTSADVFAALDLPAGPLPPGAVAPENVGTIDGNGLVSGSGQVYRGLGLAEPNPPGTPPDPGDNLDALHIGPVPTTPGSAVYFSLDASFVNPVNGVPNSGSAAAHNTLPGAVLRRVIGGGPPLVYASPVQLGLDLSGPGTDDLDALILSDNGDGVFQPSILPYDWVSPGGPSLLGGPRDMLLFSVRQGSAVIGVLDSILGLPIEPGDVLTTPLGGVGPPGIFIAAENLGLATERSGMAAFGDEVDALAAEREPYFDCNNNGVEDSVDIAIGASADTNNNGIPDECESSWSRYCECTAGQGPCGNDYPPGGCGNSTSSLPAYTGGILDASGSTSYATDDLVLTATQLPTFKTALWLSSTAQVDTPLGDGRRCVGTPFYRFGSFDTGASGSGTKGPGIVESSCITLPPGGCIGAGSTWSFQLWHRDPPGPCGNGTNLTNGLEVTFTP